MLLAIFVTYEITSRVQAPDRSSLQERTALRDSLIALNYRHSDAEVSLLNIEAKEKDSIIKSLTERKQQIITIREKVPVIINNSTNGELGDALTDYDRTH